MKAAVYYDTGPPDVFRYEDVPDPAVFPGGVVVDHGQDHHLAHPGLFGEREVDARRRAIGAEVDRLEPPARLPVAPRLFTETAAPPLDPPDVFDWS